jgi:hypothetical protein
MPTILPYFDAGLFDSALAEAVGLRPYSAQDFVTKALRLLNVVDQVSIPEAEQMQQGLDALNEMLDDWRLHTQLVLTIQPYRHQLRQGQQVYTIGPGADFDQARPIEVTRWSCILDRNAHPIIRIPHARALTLKEWQAIPQQDTGGSVIQAIYYDRGWDMAGWGKVTVYPVPTVSVLDLEMWLPTPMQGFANLSRLYAFPPGYTRAIRYNLAVELASDYPGSLTQEINLLAVQALATVKRSNFRPRYAEFDRAIVGARGRRYDPYTDT